MLAQKALMFRRREADVVDLMTEPATHRQRFVRPLHGGTVRSIRMAPWPAYP